MLFKQLIKDKIFILVISIYSIIGFSLYYYIPIQMNKIAVSQTIQNGKNILAILNGEKQFYSDIIATNALKNKPKIDNYSPFSCNYKKDGKLPYPNDSILALRDYIKNSNIKINMYIIYPFKHKGIKKLTTNELKAIKLIRNNHSKIYSFVKSINGKEIVTVAVANYITNKSYLYCHDKKLDFDWKVGDLRGLIEIKLPLDKHRYNTLDRSMFLVILLVLSLMAFSIFLYVYNIYKIDEKLKEENIKLTNEISNSFNDLRLTNKELEHDLSSMYDNFNKYVIYCKTDLFGVITEVSDAFCDISGYTSDELIGKSHNIVRHEDTKSQVYKEIWNTLNKNKIWHGEIKNKKKDGSHYWVKIFISPIYDTDNCKIGYLSIMEDITVKKDKELLAIANKLKYGERRKSKR